MIREHIYAYFREVPAWLVPPSYFKLYISRFKEIKSQFSRIVQSEVDSFFDMSLRELEAQHRTARKSGLFVEIKDTKSDAQFSIFKCNHHAVMQLGYIEEQDKYKRVSRKLAGTDFTVFKLENRWLYVMLFSSVNKAFLTMKALFKADDVTE